MQGVAVVLTNASRHQYSISNDISPESLGLKMQWSVKERWEKTKTESGERTREKEWVCNGAEYSGRNYSVMGDKMTQEETEV